MYYIYLNALLKIPSKIMVTEKRANTFLYLVYFFLNLYLAIFFAVVCFNNMHLFLGDSVCQDTGGGKKLNRPVGGQSSQMFMHMPPCMIYTFHRVTKLKHIYMFNISSLQLPKMTSHKLLQEQALLLPINVQYQNCPQDGVSCFGRKPWSLECSLKLKLQLCQRLRYIIGYAH